MRYTIWSIYARLTGEDWHQGDEPEEKARDIMIEHQGVKITIPVPIGASVSVEGS